MTNVKENLDAFNKMSNKGYEAARELGEINLRTMEKLVSRQMDMMSLFMENGLRQMTMVSEAKGYGDLVKHQIDLTKEMSERLMNESREAVKIAGDTRDEYRAWFENGVEQVSENLNKVRQVAQAG